MIIKKLKEFKFDLLLIILLGELALYTWGSIRELIFRGDGLVYLVERSQRINWYPPLSLANFDQGATLLGMLLTNIFQTNVNLYFWTELAFMLLISTLFYVMVKIITKNYLAAFAAALMFTTSYFGSWSMYAEGCYCFFMERIPNMVLMIPSFIFLHYYLERKKFIFYLASLLFYILGVSFSHWFVLFTAPFLFYPFFWSVFNPKEFSILKGSLIGVSYLLLSGFFIWLQQINQSGLGPKTYTFLGFLFDPITHQYPEKIIRQLIYWFAYVSLEYRFDVKSATQITPIVIILYTIAIIVIYKKLTQLRALLLTITFATITIFYLNSYFGRYSILETPGPNRYLYLPSALLSIFWSLFLLSVFWLNRKSALKQFIGVFFIFIFYFLNTYLIHENFKNILKDEHPTKSVFEYVINSRDKLPDSTLVILPSDQTAWYESEFLTDRLGRGEVIYIHHQNPQLETLIPNYEHIIELSFNSACNCVTEKKL